MGNPSKQVFHETVGERFSRVRHLPLHLSACQHPSQGSQHQVEGSTDHLNGFSVENTLVKTLVKTHKPMHTSASQISQGKGRTKKQGTQFWFLPTKIESVTLDMSPPQALVFSSVN